MIGLDGAPAHVWHVGLGDRDMRIVLRKVESGQLDTNTSLDAVCGMAGAAAGIKAMEERSLAGKIIVYPMLHDVPLIPLG
jgi:L-sorbose 1-phosphate reductase